MGARIDFFDLDLRLLLRLDERLADGRARITDQLDLIRMLAQLGQPTDTSMRALEAMQAHQQRMQEQRDFVGSVLGR